MKLGSRHRDVKWPLGSTSRVSVFGGQTTLLLAALSLWTLSGCRTAVEQAVRPVYASAELRPGVTVVRDIPYLQGPEAHSEKHRLDLYLPQGESDSSRGAVPVLVFAHGGSLDKGDKDLEFVGLDFYRNIGRFYSARGVAVAIVNYRLQPEASWRQQVDDVAAAASWVRSHVSDRFLSPRQTQAEITSAAADREVRLYLAGHSAGAWLVSRVALDRDVRDRFDLGEDAIAGVITISGSGFEMTDRRTWELYPKEDWWAERFAVAEGDWHEQASVAPLAATCGCASYNSEGERLRFLLLYSNNELPALARQNRLLAHALDEEGLENRLVGVSSGSHRRTVMSMSHPGKILSREILAFITTNRLDLAPIRQERVVQELVGGP